MLTMVLVLILFGLFNRSWIVFLHHKHEGMVLSKSYAAKSLIISEISCEIERDFSQSAPSRGHKSMQRRPMKRATVQLCQHPLTQLCQHVGIAP
jgi:hypothetical protein